MPYGPAADGSCMRNCPPSWSAALLDFENAYQRVVEGLIRYQSGHMRPKLFIFAWLLAPFDSFTTIFKPPPGCSSLRVLASFFWGIFSFKAFNEKEPPVAVDHFMFLPNKWLYESGYMKQQRESTGISNFGQLRHHRCTLSVRWTWLHNASAKVTNFGLPKSVGCVPEDKIWRDQKFVGCADAIWNFGIL